jgi:hypothetical protein
MRYRNEDGKNCYFIIEASCKVIPEDMAQDTIDEKVLRSYYLKGVTTFPKEKNYYCESGNTRCHCFDYVCSVIYLF